MLQQAELTQQILGRPPIFPADDAAAFRGGAFRGHRVVITGAAGTIGSALCRAAVAAGAEVVMGIDLAERGLAGLVDEMPPRVRFFPVVADVADAIRMPALFKAFRPHTVIHAAALKHVPLLQAEDSIFQAVKTNVLGTVIVLTAAVEARAQRVVLMSTDKAVQPGSVMGKTKAAAESFTRALAPVVARQGGPLFAIVRSGNVLWSSGSVTEKWWAYGKAGRPLPVVCGQRPLRRYFVGLDDVVTTVALAAAQALPGGAYTFVPDMGDPLTVESVARSIAIAWDLPDAVQIRYIGARPGDRPEESLFWPDEVQSVRRPGLLAAEPRASGPGIEWGRWVNSITDALIRDGDGIAALSLAESAYAAPQPAAAE